MLDSLCNEIDTHKALNSCQGPQMQSLPHFRATIRSRVNNLAWWCFRRFMLPVTGPDDRRGDWLHTYSGGRFWPMDPRSEDVRVEDIAHHLGMKARFSGACTSMLSVAQHAVELSYLVPGGAEEAFAALHHDDTEAFLPDVPTPVKPYLPFWKTIEGLHEQAIVKDAFGVTSSALRTIKPYDKRIVADEAACLLMPSKHQWRVCPEPLGVVIKPWDSVMATRRYLERHNELMECMSVCNPENTK